MAMPAHEHVDPAHTHSTAPVARRSWNWAGLMVRVVLTLVGAAGMVASAFGDWARGTSAQHISVRSLWSTRFDHPSNDWLTTLAFVMVVLGLLAVVGLAPRSGWLTSFAGALGIAVFVLFLIQVYRAPGNLSVSDLDTGAWIALGGSLIALVAGFFGTRRVAVGASPAVVST